MRFAVRKRDADAPGSDADSLCEFVTPVSGDVLCRAASIRIREHAWMDEVCRWTPVLADAAPPPAMIVIDADVLWTGVGSASDVRNLVARRGAELREMTRLLEWHGVELLIESCVEGGGGSLGDAMDVLDRLNAPWIGAALRVSADCTADTAEWIETLGGRVRMLSLAASNSVAGELTTGARRACAALRRANLSPLIVVDEDEASLAAVRAWLDVISA